MTNIGPYALHLYIATVYFAFKRIFIKSKKKFMFNVKCLIHLVGKFNLIEEK